MKIASDPPTPVHPTISVGAGRRLLAGERRRLEELIAGLERHGLVGESEAGTPVDMGPHSQHPADSATETFDREHEVTLLADARAELAEVDAAEERLSAGRYGICERCGEPIPEERLEARPATRFCVGDEERYEFGGRYLDDLVGEATEAPEPAVEPEPIDEFLAEDDEELGETVSPSGPEDEAMTARSGRWLEAEELEAELSSSGLLEDAVLGEESRAAINVLEEEILTADVAELDEETTDDERDSDDDGLGIEPGDVEVDLSSMVRSQFGLDARAEQTEPVEEVPAAAARGANEFLCASCFQVKSLRLLADAVASRCVDCLNNT